MFNKGKKDKERDLPDPPAHPGGSSSKRSSMKSKAPSIFSSDLTMTGSIVSEGEVQLDGNVEGDVKAGSLIIGDEASVKGEVVAENVVVRGRVTGSVRARHVQLASTARIEGDIIHAALSVESGAYFNGNCKHSSDPMAGKGAPANDDRKSKSGPPPIASDDKRKSPQVTPLGSAAGGKTG